MIIKKEGDGKMFGYVVTDRAQLSKDEQMLYRSYYCGLCRTLREHYGIAGQLALNFDMTFLYILLSSLYEPTEQVVCERCMVHPFQKRDKRLSEIAHYCADMTVMLAYYNAMDDWYDDHKRSKLRYAKKLESAVKELADVYPRQSEAIKQNIEAINVLEREQEINLDAVSNCFGALFGQIFVWKEDVWRTKLYELGNNLGKFIYFMDAWEDAKKDARHKNYNPLLQIKHEQNYEQRCKDILTMFLGEAALAFEALPIVDNAHILRNILYAGVWSKFTEKKT